ncbi:MAG: DUF86 domain-containing protein [Leptospiraceae bacterium]|nr:DUF86 domain-containing protein [Leptospiraceae bacterium]MCP5493487.1 DUF86 domain-containing protein [Leptospiraceae bacterium]
MQVIKEIQSYINGKTFSEFKTDSMLRSACLHQLSIIGDAFANLSEQIRIEYNDVDWKGYIGL